MTDLEWVRAEVVSLYQDARLDLVRAEKACLAKPVWESEARVHRIKGVLRGLDLVFERIEQRSNDQRLPGLL